MWSRLTVLKKSLQLLRANPGIAGDLRTVATTGAGNASVIGLAGIGETRSDHPLARSMSTATLGVLATMKTMISQPMRFDENLESLLEVVEDVMQSIPEEFSRHSTNGYAYPILSRSALRTVANPNNDRRISSPNVLASPPPPPREAPPSRLGQSMENASAANEPVSPPAAISTAGPDEEVRKTLEQYQADKSTSDQQEEGKRSRERTMSADGITNVLQSQKMHWRPNLMDAVTTPYFDIPRPSVMQRSMSSANLSTTASTLNLAPMAHIPVAETSFSVTPLPPVASKYSQKHAVFTTSAEPPYRILSANDMACLTFGTSQHQLRTSNLLEYLEPAYRASIVPILQGEVSRHGGPSEHKEDHVACVLMTGRPMPIIKCNGSRSVASFWVQKNHTGFLAWVIEEIACLKVSLRIHPESGVIKSITGESARQLFPSIELESDGSVVPERTVDELVPHLDMTMEERDEEYDKDPKMQYITLNGSESVVPSFSYRTKSSSDDGCAHFRIVSMPQIAGTIIVDQKDLKIQDYNREFMRVLLGYETHDNTLIGRHVSQIMPQFPDYLQRVLDECSMSLRPGTVVPEHMFRKLTLMTENVDDAAEIMSPLRGINAVTVQGSFVKVDVQLRIVTSTHYGLWISYTSTLTNSTDTYEVPSQLSLLSSVLDKEALIRANRRKSSSVSSLGKQVGLVARRDSADSSTVGSEGSEDNLTKLASETATSSPQSPSAANTSALSDDKYEIGSMRRSKKITDYKIEQKMGEGAYGRVLLVRPLNDPNAESRILKCVIKERILVDTWTRDRKLGTIPNEIKIMYTLNQWPHSNIIRLIDFFEDDEFYHVEMERHGNPGTDLFDLIELKQDMEEKECRDIFRQVVSAVAHLHSHGIIHRDIKDENIIVDENGHVKLIDFGSAAHTKQGPFDVFVGTIDYAAPEVLGGRPYEGKPQDVWALGILLYTIVYKENPFYNVDEIMDGELRIPFVMSLASLELIEKILTRNPRNRPTVDDIASHRWLRED